LWRLQAVLHFLRGRPKLLTSTGHATNYVRRTNPTKPPYKVQTVQYLLLYYCITFLFLDVLGTLRHLIEICLFEIDSFFLSFYLPVRFAEKCYEYFYSIERVRRESESLAGKSASRMTDRSIDATGCHDLVQYCSLHSYQKIEIDMLIVHEKISY
jgi:hypothetical protein